MAHHHPEHRLTHQRNSGPHRARYPSKPDLRARPLFARKRDAIEAHLTVVFTGLAVSREVQNRTGLAIRNVARQLRSLRSATIAINASSRTFPPEIPAHKQAILEAIHRPLLTH